MLLQTFVICKNITECSLRFEVECFGKQASIDNHGIFEIVNQIWRERFPVEEFRDGFCEARRNGRNLNGSGTGSFDGILKTYVIIWGHIVNARYVFSNAVQIASRISSI